MTDDASTARYGILGPLALEDSRGGGLPASPAVLAPRPRAVLALLLLVEGQPVPVRELHDLVWADSTGSSRGGIQVAVHRLRAWLAANDAGRIEFGPGGYRLTTPGGSLDATRFRRLAAEGLPGPDRPANPDRLAAALGLWRGPVLADLPDALREHPSAQSLAELRLSVLRAYARCCLDAGRPEHALPHVEVAAAELAYDESVHAALADLLAAAGRQADALRVVETVRRRLADELGVDIGSALRAAQLRILRQEYEPPAVVESSAARGAAEPRWRGPRPSGELIGRTGESDELAALLARRRLVTVVGLGGVGKTTLALRVAERLADRAEVTVVPLASARSFHDVVAAVGQAFEAGGVTDDDVLSQVEKVAGARDTLLVLDDCEHVHAAGAGIARRLIAATGAVRVLATSRQPLATPGEVTWRLGTLTEPDAVHLFLARAAEAVPSFAPTPDDLVHAARICRRLDGLPLALELAAARLRTLDLPELADRLERGLTLLSTGAADADDRHASLTRMIDTSYRLLDDAGRILLACLAVFRGGFTLEAAEAVCADEPRAAESVLPALASLIDRSLVEVYDTGPGRRYRLLEAIRDYAYRLSSPARVSDAGQRALPAPPRSWAVPHQRRTRSGPAGPAPHAWRLSRTRRGATDTDISDQA